MAPACSALPSPRVLVDNAAIIHRSTVPNARHAAQTPPRPVGGLLLSAPILLNLVFFVLLAMISGGLYNYSVVALGRALWTPVATANMALSANLLLSAIGVLLGGVLVGRTTAPRHGGDRRSCRDDAFHPLIAEIDLGAVALIGAMSLIGLFSGIIMPSRDMIVREITPPGSFGKVFGFVTTGFNIGGIISPLIFGAIMDHGNPRLVFLAVAAFTLIAILTVATRRAAIQAVRAPRTGLMDLSNQPNCPMSGHLRVAAAASFKPATSPVGG